MTNSPENRNRGEITKWQEIEIFQIEPFRIEAVRAILGSCYCNNVMALRGIINLKITLKRGNSHSHQRSVPNPMSFSNNWSLQNSFPQKSQNFSPNTLSPPQVDLLNNNKLSNEYFRIIIRGHHHLILI